tara:strand:- start:2303 stop:2821 length:519 start_codon:yes stop_codon:yes gene_type:complete
MTTSQHRQQSTQLLNSNDAGFTMVEVVIAGGVLLMVLVGIARISIQSITSGRYRAERDKIEAAIHNNIQLIQQADSKLSLDSMASREQRIACLDPSTYLKKQLEESGGAVAVPPPVVKGIDGKNPIRRVIKPGQQPGITVITYEFKAPENSIKDERRIIELNPNFQSHCILE